MTLRTLFAACVMVCACQPDDTVSLGTFRVVATRTASTCGAQSGEFAPRIEYNVELKTHAGLLVWEPVGANTARGLWTPSSRSFRLLLESDMPVWPADRRREIVGCTVRRTDVVEGVIEMDDADGGVADAGAPDDAGTAPRARSFRATETIVFGATPGSDCRALIGAGDGQFTTMPCDVTYALEAQRVTRAQ